MGMGPKCGWNLPQEVNKSFQKSSLLRTYRKGCLSPGVDEVDLLPNIRRQGSCSSGLGVSLKECFAFM